MKCRFYEQCGYQRQMCGEYPDVWVVAADILSTRIKFRQAAARDHRRGAVGEGLTRYRAGRLVGRDRQPDHKRRTWDINSEFDQRDLIANG